MDLKKLHVWLLVPALFIGCNLGKEIQQVNLAEVEVVEEVIPSRPTYNPEETQKFDLIHTKLEVSFDWGKKHLFGKAELTLSPYFYSTNELVLDAKGFEVHQVALINGESMQPLNYEYDGWELNIDLDKVYDRSESLKIFIDYTAKPDELKTKGGSAAITGDKGLYFINPDGSNPNVKPQIWTQGETEASSCWFPTIDAPNQRTTQEIYITVEDKHTTLSNGVLVSSTKNEDNTRTDYWKMDKPHTPYLFMMAVGPFEKVEDEWRDLDIDYYVEPEEAPYAKLVFGATPEMLEFYSNLLGVDYPWSKYAQIVVREYVSGAMENTTAVIHGDFLYNDDRSILDGNGEDIIAHELFHHWFGDLVTCESWANLPLNESFATYGEYLWREYKHGRASADYHLLNDLNAYLAEARGGKMVDMVRFNYEDKEDMFDSHSYAKGGRILHMLRKYLGDEAFFLGLQKYLQDHAFTAVEMHELRLAMEEVCGEDLNWFFNQWFFSAGHPELEISTDYDAESSEVIVYLKQNQDLDQAPLYKLPMAVDVYTEGGKTRHEIVFDTYENWFRLPAEEEPLWVNVDAEKMLLCVKQEEKPDSEWVAQFNMGKLFLDKLEALRGLNGAENETITPVLEKALKDEFWKIRETAIEMIEKGSDSLRMHFESKIYDLAKNDPKSAVRASAIACISEYENQDINFYFERINDKSYQVASTTLRNMNEHFPEEAYQMANKMQTSAKRGLKYAIAEVYAESGAEGHLDFFNESFESLSGFQIFQFHPIYTKYLGQQKTETILSELDRVEEVARNGSPWFVRFAGMQMLTALKKSIDDKEENADNTAAVEKIESLMEEIKDAETHPQLKGFYGRN